MLTPPDRRVDVLVGAGVPMAFLDALDRLGDFNDLQYIIKPPDAAYHYLPQLLLSESYLDGWVVTPVCDGNNGDTFYVFLENRSGSTFACCNLEAAEIQTDFGQNPNALLANLLIELYEFSERPVPDIIDVGERLGFAPALQLFTALQRADDERSRATFSSDAMWRAQNLPTIVGC